MLPSRAVNLESEKFPNAYVSVLNSGQLHPESEQALPGPAQAFFCYVKVLVICILSILVMHVFCV